MPISARMSLWGLYQYDSTILDNLSVPTGMDSDNLKQNLLVETASLSVLYPDPDFLKTVIGLWSAERADVWNKLYETTQLQYNPIENYDRLEESEEQNTGISTAESSGTTSNSNTQSRNTSQADNVSRSGTNTATNSATAYNSNTFADTAQTISSGSDDSSSISNGAEDISVSGSENTSTIGSASNTGNRIFKSRTHGNIGVTTSQQMIEAQREVVQFCMTEFIINEFIQRFCVMVY